MKSCGLCSFKGDEAAFGHHMHEKHGWGPPPSRGTSAVAPSQTAATPPAPAVVRARPPEVNDRQQAIHDAMTKAGGVGWQTRGEVKELPKILWPDELPLKVIRGNYESGTGLLVATDRRLIFINKGLVSLKVEDFGYEKITSVQYKTGMLMGEIDILASGNRATFKNIEKAHVRDFGDWLRARISAPKASSTPPSTLSASDEIRSLAELHRQGILTDEEFSAKKKQLLGL
jgi:hypothetical protein